MPRDPITVRWQNAGSTQVRPGTDWLRAAREAGFTIPTGCLGGSCGACEIEVNGRVVRACVATVPAAASGVLEVMLASDPYW